MTDTTTTIAKADLDMFAGLNVRTREVVTFRLAAMRRIHKAVNSGKTQMAICRKIASEFHGERGWSAKNLMTLYKAYADSGYNWRALVDAAKAGEAWQNVGLANALLPDAFLDYLAQQWAQKQRDKFKSTYARLLLQFDRWRHGDKSAAIPGYDDPPEIDPESKRNVPRGWTYDNLLRAVKPRVSKFSRKLVQIGPKAASQLGPKILTTRADLAVGQYYILDDSWNDFKVIAFGQACRLLSFHVLDLFSGCNIARGYKPALKDEREVETRLKEQEMVWLLVKLLTTDGYHPAGCTIICEKGTATIREREEEIFQNCLDGLIKVQRGPMGGGPGIAAQFTGPHGGNPRWKAPLESWFNLLRNRTDDLLEFPGQTGSNSRLNAPEGLPGLEKDNLALMRAARALPADRAELLRLGLLSHTDAIFKLDAITEVINCRIDHALEGWREAGHFIEEFRLNPQMRWEPMTRLLDYDPVEREAVATLIRNSSSLLRNRALSPREVFDAGRPQLTRIPLSVAALLMDDLIGLECTVKNSCLELSWAEAGPGELTYGLTRRDGRGVQTPLRDDEKFLVRINPLDPRVCWLYQADGSFAGIAPHYSRVSRADASQLQHAFAAKKQALAPLIAEGRRLAANITQAATDRAAHNASIFGPAPTTEDRQALKESRRQGPAAADDILAGSDQPSTPVAASDAGDQLLSTLLSSVGPAKEETADL